MRECFSRCYSGCKTLFATLTSDGMGECGNGLDATYLSTGTLDYGRWTPLGPIVQPDYISVGQDPWRETWHPVGFGEIVQRLL